MRLATIVLVGAFMAVAPAEALGQITIGTGAGPASPYPSTLEYPPAERIIEDVEVRLTDLDHDFPDELDIAVTGPGDRTVMLTSDLGETSSCLGLPDLRFSAQAAGPVPEGPLPCDGTYRPFDRDPEPGDSDEGDSDLFAAPAPIEPFATGLDVFKGSMMGGTWSLRVMDDTADDGGTIASWLVRFDTRVLGRVSMPASGVAVPETDALVGIELTRFGGSAAAPLGPGSVAWTVLPEQCLARKKAVAGEDFAPAAGSVQFGPGETTQRLFIGLIDDHVPEETECFRVALTGRSGDAALPTTQEVIQVTLTSDDRIASRPQVFVPSRPQRVLRAKAVKVRASSAVYGTLSATGRIALPGNAAASVRLKPARPVAVTPGQRVALKLRLSRQALRAVRRAFARRPRLVATVKVTAADLADIPATRSVRIKLRR
jgi:hypothetical protein